MEIRINKLTRALNQDTNDMRVAALCSLLDTDVNPNTKLNISVYNSKGIHIDDEYALDITDLYQLQTRIDELITRRHILNEIKLSIGKLRSLGIKEATVDGYMISEIAHAHIPVRGKITRRIDPSEEIYLSDDEETHALAK